MNTLKSLPVTGGSHLPEEAEQRQHHEQHRQRDNNVFYIHQPQRKPIFIGAGDKALLQLYGHIQLRSGKDGSSVGSINNLGVLWQGSRELLAGGGIGHGNAVAVLRRAPFQQPVPQRILITAVIQSVNHRGHHIACLTIIQDLPACLAAGKVDIICGKKVDSHTAGNRKPQKNKEQNKGDNLCPGLIQKTLHMGFTSIL